MTPALFPRLGAALVLLSLPCQAGKWNQPNGLGSQITLTYSYADLLEVGGLTLGSGFNDWEVVQKVEDALELWAHYAPINFTQVKDGGSVDIRMYHADLSGSTIGQAALPPTNSYTGSLWMRLDDSDRTWGESTLRAVTAHEVGHNLGLDHYNGGTALMNSGLNQAIKDRLAGGELYPNDISSIQDKYGAGIGEVKNTRNWRGPVETIANWTVDENWRVAEDAGSGQPAFRPTKNSNVKINRGAVSISGGDRLGRWLKIGENAGETARLKMNGGTLTLRHSLGLTVGLDGSGRVQHLDGTINTPLLRLGGDTASETASYELDGGILKVAGNITDIGAGVGTFRLAGGTLNKANLGNVTVDHFVFRGTDTGQTLLWNLAQTLRAKESMTIGDTSGRTATLQLRDGTLRVDGEILNGAGTSKLLLQGGNVNLSGSIAVDEFRVGNGANGSDFAMSFGNDVTAETVMQVGGGRNGTFTQTGGRVETAQLQLAGGTAGNEGAYNLDSGTLAVSGNITDGGAGTAILRLRGGTLETTGLGTVTVDQCVFNDETLVWDRPGTFRVKESLTMGNAAGKSAIFVLQSGTMRVDGSWSDGAGSSTLRVEGGTLDVAGGVVDVDSLVVMGGNVQDLREARGDLSTMSGSWGPGASAGEVGVGGDYVLGSSATLEIELGGVSPGTEHDSLDIAGNADLQGGLEVSLISGFEPQPGDEFVILEFASRSGSFSSVSGLQTPGGIELVPIFTSNSLLLVATIGGDVLDVDGDGLPNDWEELFFGTTTAADPSADTDADGVSDGDEFLFDTDPTDRGSNFAIQVSQGNPGAAITFDASIDRVYTLLATDDLENGPWTAVPGQIAVPGTGPAMNLTDPSPATVRFYRVMVSLP